MCGIVGLFSPDSKITLTDDQFRQIRDEMTHRGPDGAGHWRSDCSRVLLGHRRLSIIDLHTVASQPMCNEDGQIWVTFNGEIYNHIHLRQELTQKGHVFKTEKSDTEVLVHGFEEWGIDGLCAKLEGDYAFGLWCGRTQKLYAVRDRIGVKPLYFSFLGDSLIFASEIKVLLKHPQTKRQVNPIAMYHYLSFLTTPAPMTMFEGIYKLPAAHYLEMDNDGQFKAKRYWDVTSTSSVDLGEFETRLKTEGEKYLIDETRNRLVQSVEKRMMSDVPMGVFLSGGVDSSTNVALMSRYSSSAVKTFTVGFKDYTHLNELNFANDVSQKFKTDHHEILIDRHDMESYLQNLVYSQDEPLADWVCIPLYFVSKLAKDSGMTVIQVGEGADEQFSGYASYMGYLNLYHKYWVPFQKMPSFLQGAISKAANVGSKLYPKLDIYADIIDRAYRDREHFWSGATVFWDTLKDKLVNKQAFRSAFEKGCDSRLKDLEIEKNWNLDTFSVIKSFRDAHLASRPNHDILARMIYNEFQLRLPELLLMRVDKITMSQSLEARVPFLDHRLVEFSSQIPMEYKVKNGVAKYILKKAVEDIIPHHIIYRKKMGFAAPMSQWLRESFGQTIEDAILSSPLLKHGFFNVSYIAQLFQDHRKNRRDNSLYIWTLYNLTAWYDYWIEGKI